MSSASLSALAAIVLACWASFAPSQDEPIRFGDPIRGQRLFVEKGCVPCHAVRGAGGRIGPDLGRKTARGSFYEIAALMWNHSPGMSGKMAEFRIARPSFEENELSDLAAFLYFLNYFDEPGDPRAGKILFVEKQCVRCHRAGGEGGTAGPPLDTIPRDVSPLHIAGALWNHGPSMISSIEASGLEVPKFADTEILDLFAYLRSQGARQGTPRFQSPGDPRRGREVFEQKGCGACHPVLGEEPGVGPDLGRMELRGSAAGVSVYDDFAHHPTPIAETLAGVRTAFPNRRLGAIFGVIFFAAFIVIGVPWMLLIR